MKKVFLQFTGPVDEGQLQQAAIEELKNQSKIITPGMKILVFATDVAKDWHQDGEYVVHCAGAAPYLVRS